MTEGERIATLETLVALHRDELREVNRKLDDLLSLRDRGLGAFWLAASLIGTGVVGTVLTFISWLKG